MPERTFIEKRKRKRDGAFLTPRLILGLLLLSGIMAGAFYLEFGDIGDSLCEGACESAYGLGIWVLAGIMLLLGIITVAALIGTIFAAIRRNRRSEFEAFLDKDTKS